MSEFAHVPSHMATASAVATGASGDVRVADGSDALATLASALPGSTIAEIMPELGDLWETGISGWCGSVDGFAASIDGASQEGAATDGSVGGLFDWLGAWAGGS